MSAGNANIGEKAPEFNCKALGVDGTFSNVKLSDYAGKYVVLFFYPMDFTFVCPTEIIAFSEANKTFEDNNCAIIAVSCDSVYSHLAWVSKSRKTGGLGSINIPIMADTTHSIAINYGCFKADEGVAYRGLYIIDTKGILRQITINDLPVGRSVDEVLRLVKAFQFTDEHGEVCPANWHPGRRTIKPTVTGSKTFFAKTH